MGSPIDPQLKWIVNILLAFHSDVSTGHSHPSVVWEQVLLWRSPFKILEQIIRIVFTSNSNLGDDVTAALCTCDLSLHLKLRSYEMVTYTSLSGWNKSNIRRSTRCEPPVKTLGARPIRVTLRSDSDDLCFHAIAQEP